MQEQLGLRQKVLDAPLQECVQYGFAQAVVLFLIYYFIVPAGRFVLDSSAVQINASEVFQSLRCNNLICGSGEVMPTLHSLPLM